MDNTKRDNSDRTVREDIERKFVAFMNRGNPPSSDYEKQLVEKHIERVKYILEGGFPPPYELEIQSSSTCNLRCKHCFGRYYPPLPNRIGKEEMAEIAKKVADFHADGFKIETVKFCGTTGEPLVNPATAEGIRIFKGLERKVVVFTNGLFLDRGLDSNMMCFYDAVIEADQLILSLDAGLRETFYLLKGKDGFERVIDNLEIVIDKKRQRGSHLDVVISYVIGADNYYDIVRATQLAREIGADEIRFRVDFTNTTAIRELSEIITTSLEEARQYAREGFKVVSIYSKEGITKDDSEFHSYGRKCFNHHFWACIGPDSELYACGHRTHSEVRSYGSVLKYPLQELWWSRERLESVGRLPDEHCKICSPSSARRNTFMAFLSQLPLEHAGELCQKWVYGKNDK